MKKLQTACFLLIWQDNIHDELIFTKYQPFGKNNAGEIKKRNGNITGNKKADIG